MPDQPTKITVTNAPAPYYPPTAAHLPVKLKAGMVQQLKELKSGGNPEVEKIAAAAALALIESFGAEANGFSAQVETNSTRARQIMVIVTPHQL